MNQFKIKKGLIVNGDGGTILDVQGSNGELFSVNDNFSGILFSVNNISGLPIMTVSSDNSIVMGQFGLNVLTLTGNSVGIGTASPTANLHVVGNARVTGAILDSTNAPGTSGQVLTSTVTGTDWKSLAEISGVDGTGTANYLSKWADADTITNSIVYDNGTNVGIGTTSPFVKFDVRGEAILLYRPAANAYAMYSAANNSYSWQFGINNGSDYIIWGGGFTAPGTERFRITSGGNVGIGTTSPTDKLTVVGNISIFSTYKLYNGSASDSAGITFPNSTTRIDGFNGITFHASSTNVGSQTERMRITSGGNVGIGTTAPGALLDVNGSLGSGKSIIRVTNSDTANYITVGAGIPGISNAGMNFTLDGTSKMVLSAGGNVGIGTTAPTNPLHVEKNAGGSAIAYFNSLNADGYGVAIRTADTGNDKYVLRLDSNSGSTPVMYATNAGNVGIGTTSPTQKLHVVGSRILVEDTNAGVMFRTGGADRYSVASVGGAFQIYDEVNSTNRLYITSTGNVGIGTTSPGTKLQVAGTIRATGTTGIVDVDPLYGAFRFYNGSTFYGGFYNDAVLSAGNAVDLVSYVATGDYYIGSATTAKAVKVEQGGNVGIGTTSPTEKLDVNGVVNANSFSAGGTAGFTGTVVFASNPPGSQMLDFQGGLLVSVS